MIEAFQEMNWFLRLFFGVIAGVWIFLPFVLLRKLDDIHTELKGIRFKD